MRSTKCLVVAAVLAAGIGSARANTYTYTQPISGFSNDSLYLNFTAQQFNHKLGFLTGVNFTVNGGMVADVYDSNRVPHTQAPLPLTFTAGISIITDGFGVPEPGSYVTDAGLLTGVGTDDMVQASGPVSASFTIPASALAVYYTPRNYGYLDDTLVFGAIDHITGTHQLVGFDGQAFGFSGEVVQTFTYTPHGRRTKPIHVPEPGSLALLATAAVMLAGTTKLTKPRRR